MKAALHMADRGYIRFYRSIFSHPAFRDEPFTEREAWLWLCANAAWKPRRQRLGEHVVDLARGELVGAVRFLCEKWGWRKSRAERFIKRLKTETMIETRTGTGITVISICNYDTYQGVDDETETEMGRSSGQSRDATETEPGQSRDNRKELLNTLEEDKEGKEDIYLPQILDAASSLTPKPNPKKAENPAFEAWWKQYPRRVDKGSARKAYERVVKSGKASDDQLMSGVLRYAAERANEDPRFTKHPSTWLNAEGWGNEPPGHGGLGLPFSPSGGPRSRADSAIDGMMSYFADRAVLS